MMSLKQKLVLTIVSVFILAVSAVIFGVLPVIEKVKISSYNMAFKQSTLALIDIQIDNLKDFQSKKSGYNQALARMDDIFVDNSAPVSFIEFLEEQARIANLKLTIQPLSLSAQQSADSPIGLQLILEGKFSRSLLFLDRIEQSHWLFKILEISVSRFSVQTLETLKDFAHLSVGDVTLRINVETISK